MVFEFLSRTNDSCTESSESWYSLFYDFDEELYYLWLTAAFYYFWDRDVSSISVFIVSSICVFIVSTIPSANFTASILATASLSLSIEIVLFWRPILTKDIY